MVLTSDDWSGTAKKTCPAWPFCLCPLVHDAFDAGSLSRSPCDHCSFHTYPSMHRCIRNTGFRGPERERESWVQDTARSLVWNLTETGWKTLFRINCCERKTLFRLKKEDEYGVSRTWPVLTTATIAKVRTIYADQQDYSCQKSNLKLKTWSSHLKVKKNDSNYFLHIGVVRIY